MRRNVASRRESDVVAAIVPVSSGLHDMAVRSERVVFFAPNSVVVE